MRLIAEPVTLDPLEYLRLRRRLRDRGAQHPGARETTERKR